MQEAIQKKGEMKNFFFIAWGVMFVLNIITFGASIRYGFSILDDRFLVLGNFFIRGLTTENIVFSFTHFDPELYIPLTFVSYQLTYLFSGLNAEGYHFVNILIHAGNAALVSSLAMQLSSRKYFALIVGIVFCLHPLHTEAVVWIAGRKDLLSTFFALLTIVFYIQYRTTKNRKLYLASILTLLLGLLSKASVMTIPLVLIAIDLGIEHRKMSLTLLKEKIPHIGLAIIFAAVALLGKERVVQSSTLLETLLMAGKSTVFYVQKLVLPTELTTMYPWNGAISPSDLIFIFPIIIVIIIFAFAASLLRKERGVFTAFTIFLIMLSPSFFNFHKGDSMFFAVDRYAYMPSISLIILASFFMQSVIDRTHIRNLSRGITVLCLTIIVSLSLLSMRQTKTWATDITMLENAVKLYPASIPGRVSLAAAYREAGRFADEERVLLQGIKLYDSVSYHTALGSVYARQKNFTEAMKQYDIAKSLDPKNPEPYFFMGSLLEEQSKTDEALAAYQRAISLDDSYVAAYNNAGGILRERNDLNAAEEMFRKAIEWNPSFMEGEYNLFEILETKGLSEEALPHLEKAYALNPDSSDIALSLAYQYDVRDRTKDALVVTEQALENDPENRALKRLKQSIETRR